jgi:hypothetical protein
MAKTNPNQKILIYAIGVGAGYLLIVRPLLVKLGIVKSSAEIQQEIYQSGNVQDYINTAVAKQTPTKSKGEWQIVADQLYYDLKFASPSDDKADAGYQISRVQNDADFALLYDTFGKRQEYYFGIPAGGLQDLVQMVTSNLDRAALNKINDNYLRKGIKFRF